jgi:hypothetical protein
VILKTPESAMPHRGHDARCPQKPKKKTAEEKKEEARLKELQRPMSESEKLQGVRQFSKGHFDAYFRPRYRAIRKEKNMHRLPTILEESNDGGDVPNASTEGNTESNLTESDNAEQIENDFEELTRKAVIDWHGVVAKFMDNKEEVKKWEDANVGCPLPFCAVAEKVAADIFPKRMEIGENGELSEKMKEKLAYASIHFNSQTMALVLPHQERDGTAIHPMYHMVEGQSLLYVCWEMFYPSVKLQCTEANCNGCLKRKRTTWSQSKKLFPIFQRDGPPMWAMVMTYYCQNTNCKKKVHANDPLLLHSLPYWVRRSYPVDPQYIYPGKG